MDGTVFLGLFVICAIITSTVTQIIKDKLKRFDNTFITLGVGVLTGLIIGLAYAGIEHSLDSHTELGIVILMLTSGFGAMYGYDKVYEAIKGQKKLDEGEENNGSD